MYLMRSLAYKRPITDLLERPIMTITKKPTIRSNQTITDLIDNVINKGLVKTEQNTDSRNDNIKITIRIPAKMLNAIDSYLESSIYSKARNVWIKEAIEKKIKEEIEI